MAPKSLEVPDVLVASFDCKQGAVRAVRHNQDGNYCITCGSDKSIKLWNPNKKLALKTYTGHGYEVLDARGSCDNSQIVSCGMDKTVMVWEVGSGLAVRKFRGHAGTVNCVRFNEDSSVAVSGSVDGTVRCWDVKSKRQEPIQVLEECKDSVTSLDVTDHEILVGSADGNVRRYDLRNGHMHVDRVGNPISTVSFTADGQCLLVGGSSGDTLKLFDKTSGELLQEFRGHVNSKYRVEAVLDCSDQAVLSGSENGQVYVWELVEGKLLAKLEHGKGDEGGGMSEMLSSSLTVHSLSYHPEQSELLTAARGHMYIWRGKSLASQVEEEEG